MRRSVATVVALVSICGASSCATIPVGNSNADKETRVVVVTSTPGTSIGDNPKQETPPKDSKRDLTDLADAYTKALDSPQSVQFTQPDGFTPKGTFSYAIAEVTGDDSPEMLFRADVSDYYAPVSVFTKKEDGSVFNTRDILIDGAASSGGGRAQTMTSGSGTGIYQSLWQSIDPNVKMQKYVFSGENLVKSGSEASIPLATLPNDEQQKINWLPSTDRSGIEALRSGELPKSAAPQGGTNQHNAQQSGQKYDYVLEGTVLEMNTEEVMEGRRAPNGEGPENRYIVVKFDSPQTIVAQKAGNKNYSGEAKWISLGKKQVSQYGSEDTRGPFVQYVGKRVRISVNSDSMFYGSGADLPFYGPKLGVNAKYNIEVL